MTFLNWTYVAVLFKLPLEWDDGDPITWGVFRDYDCSSVFALAGVVSLMLFLPPKAFVYSWVLYYEFSNILLVLSSLIFWPCFLKPLNGRKILLWFEKFLYLLPNDTLYGLNTYLSPIVCLRALIFSFGTLTPNVPW